MIRHHVILGLHFCLMAQACHSAPPKQRYDVEKFYYTHINQKAQEIVDLLTNRLSLIIDQCETKLDAVGLELEYIDKKLQEMEAQPSVSKDVISLTNYFQIHSQVEAKKEQIFQLAQRLNSYKGTYIREVEYVNAWKEPGFCQDWFSGGLIYVDDYPALETVNLAHIPKPRLENAGILPASSTDPQANKLESDGMLVSTTAGSGVGTAILPGLGTLLGFGIGAVVGWVAGKTATIAKVITHNAQEWETYEHACQVETDRQIKDIEEAKQFIETHPISREVVRKEVLSYCTKEEGWSVWFKGRMAKWHTQAETVGALIQTLEEKLSQKEKENADERRHVQAKKEKIEEQETEEWKRRILKPSQNRFEQWVQKNRINEKIDIIGQQLFICFFNVNCEVQSACLENAMNNRTTALLSMQKEWDRLESSVSAFAIQHEDKQWSSYYQPYLHLFNERCGSQKTK